jgi:hypothetical protein
MPSIGVANGVKRPRSLLVKSACQSTGEIETTGRRAGELELTVR